MSGTPLPERRVDVAVVGGGVAGCALAVALARSGVDVVVLERQPAWHWRAGGVFSSPVTVEALRRVGIGEAALARVAFPIPAMRLETPGGSVVRLTYGAEAGGPTAVGFDRFQDYAWFAGRFSAYVAIFLPCACGTRYRCF